MDTIVKKVIILHGGPLDCEYRTLEVHQTSYVVKIPMVNTKTGAQWEEEHLYKEDKSLPGQFNHKGKLS